MSANNWTVCPKCISVGQAKQAESLKTSEAAYGKVTSTEWAALLKSAETPLVIEDSLREDYEIGIRGRKFYVNYSGSCQTCGFTFNYKHEESVKIEHETNTKTLHRHAR
jgi:hypothetical protein